MLFNTIRICARIFLLLTLLFVAGGEVVQGQIGRVYADVTPTSGRIKTALFYGDAEVKNPNNAANDNNNSFATLQTDKLSLVLGLAGTKTWLQLKFPSNVPLNTTTYIKIDLPTSDGLNLDVVGILGLVGNGITIEGYRGADNSVDGNILSSPLKSSIIKNHDGDYFIAVNNTSTTPFNSLRINFSFPTGLGITAGTYYLNVYNAFYDVAPPCDVATSQNCEPLMTSDLGSSTGLSINLLSTLLANPTKAIDDDDESFSTLQSGIVAIGKVSQTIYFQNKSESNDEVQLILSIPSGLLQVGLFQNITFQLYNGSQIVGPEKTLSSLFLDINLLTLFGHNAPIKTTISSEGPFDHIVISVSKINVGGNIFGGGLNIHEVRKTIVPPVIETTGVTLDSHNICVGNSVKFTISNPQTCVQYNWFNSSNTLLKSNSTFYEINNLDVGSHTFYVEANKNGCSNNLDRIPVILTVNPKLPKPEISIQ